jgi:hypothetical protein
VTHALTGRTPENVLLTYEKDFNFASNRSESASSGPESRAELLGFRAVGRKEAPPQAPPQKANPKTDAWAAQLAQPVVCQELLCRPPNYYDNASPARPPQPPRAIARR